MLDGSVQFYVSVDDSSSFEVIGLDTLRLSLEANENITIPYEALVPLAGIHNMQTIRFTLRHGKEEETHHLPQQWLVAVSDTN